VGNLKDGKRADVVLVWPKFQMIVIKI
jgi:hypothetical protein